MASTTENVKLGVCSVLFDGVNLGLTKGGVEVEVATTTYEVKVDQFGETPISELITGRTVTASVPLAETTLENLVRTMPGAVLQTDAAVATGTVTLRTAVPANGDTVNVAGNTFTFRTVPTVDGDVKIGATFNDCAANLADAISASDAGYVATAATGIVTIKAKQTGTKWNGAITASFTTAANVTTVALTGGTDGTYARVVVSSGINVNLLSIAKRLVLRPKGTFGEDDFIIHSAATPGALSFAYSIENERVFQVSFRGFVSGTGALFQVGK